MFHSGDLSSGITLAIQQQKLVACFVSHEGEEESQTWEDGWLQEETNDGRPLGEALGDKAVLLRLEFGSQEAAFLGAFCPLEKAPTLVIIHNGQVLEKLESGVSQKDFEMRLRRVVGLPAVEESDTNINSTPTAASNGNINIQTDQSIQSMMRERSERLEVDHTERQAAEKAERIARSNARRKEAEEAAAAHGYGPGGNKGKQKATAEPTDKDKSRRDWIYQQKQRKDEAKKERERILERIEADKLERKLKAQRAKEPEEAASFTAAWQAPAPASKLSDSKKICSLQVRLFDGSSIRSQFPRTATLANEVRVWVKETSPDNAENNVPFTFRQILAPSPSRSIETSEEHQTIHELGLTPNATLVLMPIAGFTNAYSGGSSGGVLGLGYNIASSTWNLIGTLAHILPSFTRNYITPPADSGASTTPKVAASTAGPATVRVRTLANQRDDVVNKDETEFYNGNSLDFEKRNDDEDESSKKS